MYLYITDINECLTMDLPCTGHGECIDTMGSYRCICNPGWTGSQCDMDIHECTLLKPCKHNSTCIEMQGGYRCKCLPGFQGKHCEGGKVILVVFEVQSQFTNIHVCFLRVFFLRKVDNSIQSFAFYERCMYSFNIYSQYTGNSLILNAACDFFVDEFECASNPCLNGATCMETFGSFYCSCPPGWTGPRCNEGRDYIPSSCSLEYYKPSINSFVFNLRMAS